MKYEEKEIMKEDCLRIANQLCIELFKIKLVKILSLKIFIFQSVLFIVQANIFLKTMDLQYLIHYGPPYVITFFMLLTYYLTAFINKKITKAIQDVRLWKISSAGKQIEDQITKDSNYINYCVGGYAILGLFTGLQFAIPKDDDKDFVFFVVLFDKYFTEFWSNILISLCRLIIILNVPVMIIPYCQIIYATTHVRFQLKMLIHYLENMDGTTCQKEIKKRIVFCAKRHAKLYCVTNETRRQLIVLIILVTISGAIIFPSLLIFCYLTTSNIHKYLRFVSAFLLGGVAFLHIIYAGQLMENNSSEIFQTLLKVKWYEWNKENKQIYSIFLANTVKEIRINFSQEISLNYQLGTSLMKTIYSFTSVLYQFRRKARTEI